MIKFVFSVLRSLAISLLLWGIVFYAGRPIMWNAVKHVSEAHWKTYSDDNGTLRGAALSGVFDHVADISTN